MRPGPARASGAARAALATFATFSGGRGTRLVLALVVLAGCRSPHPWIDEPQWPRPARGMVVSEHPLATRVGLDVLDDGGNAIDAAVATALALAVVYPQAGNLGGGGFALYVPHTGDPRALDFRETAPALLSADAYLDSTGAYVSDRSKVGALAAGVPGTPRGLYELHAWGGVLPFQDLVEPAIELAEEGFPIDAWLAKQLREEKPRSRLERFPESAALFYPGGEPLSEGDLLVQPELAATLERYARFGPRGFYGGRSEDGPIADAIVDLMESQGGLITHEDLRAYRPIERQPLVDRFQSYQIVTMPPPSSGGIILLQVLRVLEGFPLTIERKRTLERPEEPGAKDGTGVSARALHWWIEAMRCAFADRAEHMGDPDYWQVPTETLLSQAWINRRRVSIGERANPNVGPWKPPAPGAEPWDPAAIEIRESEQTTHLCVLDEDGNAVSLTTTLNGAFGNGMLVPGAGFLLNNEMDDFSVLPGVPNEYGLVGSAANAIAGGKRPLSSMTPAVVRGRGDTVHIVIGSPGGPKIITSVIEVILRVLVYEQSLGDAVRAPRLHQQWKLGGGGAPERTLFEPGWAPELLESLRQRRHVVEVTDERWGSVQAILVELGGEPVGISDPRRGGVAGAQGLPLPEPARP